MLGKDNTTLRPISSFWNPKKTKDKGVEGGEFIYDQISSFLRNDSIFTLFPLTGVFNLLATAVKAPCSASDCDTPVASLGAGL